MGERHSMSHRIMSITVRGLLDSRWARWMPDATLTHLDGGYTLISTGNQDMHETGDIMMQLRELGLELVDIEIQATTDAISPTLTHACPAEYSVYA